ncbi:MAG: response regulator, partial [Halioglobus sp.]|nr:response regulator [Halioglobus sp.]
LGLAISKQLAESLGGTLSWDNEVTGGSRFWFTFHCGNLEDARWLTPDAQTLRDADSESESRQLPGISGLFLFAEDRQELRVLIREFIEAAGGEAVPCENGAELVKKYHSLWSQERPIAGVLMDLQMPVMDGFEATAKLRSAGFTGPIIALTANVMAKDRERSLKTGFDAFVAKPIDRVELLSVLANLAANPPADTGDAEVSVLCVEDDRDTLQAQRLLLTAKEFAVECAGSTEQALEIVETFCPDVAVLDLALAGGSGEALLRQLKSKPTLANTTFICVTGRSEEAVEWRAMGFDHFLQKPVDFEQLVTLINQSRRAG